MSGPAHRPLALLVITCLLVDASWANAAVCPLLALPQNRMPLFCAQALQLQEGSFSQNPIIPKNVQHFYKTLSSNAAISRRGLLAGTGAALLSPTLAAQPNPKPTRAFISGPLSFPEAPIPVEKWPAAAQKHLSTIGSAVRIFQTVNFQLGNNTLSIGGDHDRYFDRSARFWTTLAHDLIDEMKASGELTEDATRKLADPTLASNEEIEMIYRSIITPYFSKFGYYFKALIIEVGGAPIPLVSLRPVYPAGVISRRLRILGKPVSARLYHLGLDILPSVDILHIMRFAITAETNPATDQIFIYDEYSVQKIDQTWLLYVDLLKQYPKLRQKQFLSKEDVPSPKRRLQLNLFIKGLQEMLGDRFGRIPEAEFRAILKSHQLEELLEHEYTHVAFGSVDRLTSSFGTWSESIAELAAGFGAADVHSQLADIVSSSQNYGTSKVGSHGEEYMYLLNRLSYWFWHDHRQRFPRLWFSRTPDQFVNLPADIQTAVWDALPAASTSELWSIFQQAFHELQTADHPLLKGYDKTPSTVDIRSNNFEEFTRLTNFSYGLEVLLVVSAGIASSRHRDAVERGEKVIPSFRKNILFWISFMSAVLFLMALLSLWTGVVNWIPILKAVRPILSGLIPMTVLARPSRAFRGAA